MAILERVLLKGFKSIREMDLELRSLNVLIGANGAGKSNLISFFRMLDEMINGRLQNFVATAGRAHSLLFYGPKTTTQIQARLELIEKSGRRNVYGFALSHAAGDVLFISDERMGPSQTSWTIQAGRSSTGASYPELRHKDKFHPSWDEAFIIQAYTGFFRVYHFHDTSATALIRQYGYIGNNRLLSSDAGNLAAFLYRLKNQGQIKTYDRIVSTIRFIAPFFMDFDLVPTGPNDRDIILNWKDKDSSEIFGPHQLSDGTLRAMSLVTLLMQPESELPGLIIIDEPELGLHPYALELVASLIKVASRHTQVLISTQSSSFLDQFDPEDIIVVDREGKESVFRRPDPVALEAWLDEYSLGEVWEKNVVGGGPH